MIDETGLDLYGHHVEVRFVERVREMTAFDEEAAFSIADVTVDTENVPQQVRAMMATPSLFRLLKIARECGGLHERGE